MDFKVKLVSSSFSSQNLSVVGVALLNTAQALGILYVFVVCSDKYAVLCLSLYNLPVPPLFVLSTHNATFSNPPPPCSLLVITSPSLSI